MRNLARASCTMILLLAMTSAAVFAALNAPQPAGASKLVVAGKDGHLQYAPAAHGDAIPDFSNCGYMGGGVRLPNLPAKLTLDPDPKSNDDTSRIQKAIDQVSEMPTDDHGWRGA